VFSECFQIPPPWLLLDVCIGCLSTSEITPIPRPSQTNPRSNGITRFSVFLRVFRPKTPRPPPIKTRHLAPQMYHYSPLIKHAVLKHTSGLWATKSTTIWPSRGGGVGGACPPDAGVLPCLGFRALGGPRPQRGPKGPPKGPWPPPKWGPFRALAGPSRAHWPHYGFRALRARNPKRPPKGPILGPKGPFRALLGPSLGPPGPESRACPALIRLFRPPFKRAQIWAQKGAQKGPSRGPRPGP